MSEIFHQEENGGVKFADFKCVSCPGKEIYSDYASCIFSLFDGVLFSGENPYRRACRLFSF